MIIIVICLYFTAICDFVQIAVSSTKCSNNVKYSNYYEIDIVSLQKHHNTKNY